MSPDDELPIDLDPRELERMLASDEVPLLVDCREPWEHETVHLEGDVLIPLSQIADRADELPQDRKVVAYCHHGIRSRYAAAMLRQAGIAGARSLRGGIDLWARDIDPSLPRY